MSTSTQFLAPQKKLSAFPKRLLNCTAILWLAVTTAGQWLFGTYIILVYGSSTYSGDLEKWNEILPHGYVAGDWKGNLIVGSHVLLAAILAIGGPVQLVTALRISFPRFHCWLGRIYVVTAIPVATAGLLMIWTRGGVGDEVQHISISVQAIYIIIFALLTIKYARARQFEIHRKWALRLFMVVSGVWFFRVQLMGWLLLNGGPAGFDPETFTGPFLTFLSIFTYGIPFSVLILEMYFYAQHTDNKTFSILTSMLILLITIFITIGIFAATMGMWLPRILG